MRQRSEWLSGNPPEYGRCAEYLLFFRVNKFHECSNTAHTALTLCTSRADVSRCLIALDFRNNFGTSRLEPRCN
jgi:hypothetical protein